MQPSPSRHRAQSEGDSRPGVQNSERFEYQTVNGPILVDSRKLQKKIGSRSRFVDSVYDVYQSEFGKKAKRTTNLAKLPKREILPQHSETKDIAPGQYDIYSKTEMFEVKSRDRASSGFVSSSGRFKELYKVPDSRDSEIAYPAPFMDSVAKGKDWQRPTAAMRGTPARDRLQFKAPETSDVEVEYNGMAWSDFAVKGVASAFLSAAERFKSPPSNPGPGEYQTQDETEFAQKAVQWARQAAAQMSHADQRFPSPKLGPGPGEFATQQEIDDAKRIIMWARQAAFQDARVAAHERLPLPVSETADLDYTPIEGRDFAYITNLRPGVPHAELRSKTERFKGPEPDEKEPITYPDRLTTEVTRGVYPPLVSEVQRFFFREEKEKFPAPGEYDVKRSGIGNDTTPGLLSRASRLPSRLIFPEELSHTTQEALGLEQTLFGENGHENWARARERFPSPVLSEASGLHTTPEEVEQLHRMIHWARVQSVLTRLNDPRFSETESNAPGPGEYLSTTEIEDFKRIQGVRFTHPPSRVHEKEPLTARVPELDHSLRSDFLFDPRQHSHWRPNQLFPSPTMDKRVYADVEQFEFAQQAVRWARQAIQTGNSVYDRFQAAKENHQLGPGEYETAEDLEYVKKQVLWSRLRSQACVPSARSRLEFLQSNDSGFDAELLSDFGNSKTNHSASWQRTARDYFPSPELNIGGEYTTKEDIDLARKAVEWARQAAVNYRIWGAERFPEPTNAELSSLLAYESADTVEQFKKEVMWSRMRGQVGMAQAERLQLAKEMANDGLYECYISDFESTHMAQPMNWGLARDTFPSPEPFNGDYLSVEDIEFARKVVYWARQQAISASAKGERFPIIKSGAGGDYFTEEEIGEAKKEILWSRMRAQCGTPARDRLKFKGAMNDELYENVLSDFEKIPRNQMSWSDARSMFPSPQLQDTLGDYTTAEELDFARQCVNWARQQTIANRKLGVTRFPEPPFGNGPGEFATAEDVDQAKREVLWSRLQGQIGRSRATRLEFARTHCDELYGAVVTDFKPKPGCVEWRELRARFPSPELNQGDYATQEEVEWAKRAVYWSRQQALIHARHPERFPQPAIGVGPGEFTTQQEVDFVKREIVWARLRAQVGQPEEGRLRSATTPNAESFLSEVVVADPILIAQVSSRAKSVIERFPSPQKGLGPGEYDNEIDLMLAKRAVSLHRARLTANPRFVEAEVTLGPGDFATPDEVEYARRAVEWSRALGQRDRLRGHALEFISTQGADLLYENQLVSEFEIPRDGRQKLSGRDMFPSPEIGTGPGEYLTKEEYDMAKQAVSWARGQVEGNSKLERFPSPKIQGTDSEYATQDEVEWAKQAIVWSRLKGMVDKAVYSRLVLPEAANYNSEIEDPNDFRLKLTKLAKWDEVERFVEGEENQLGPGDYSSIEETNEARLMSQLARKAHLAAFCRTEDRFKDSNGAMLAPGEYDTDLWEMNEQARRWQPRRFQGSYDPDMRNLPTANNSKVDGYLDEAIHMVRGKQWDPHAKQNRLPAPELTLGPGDYSSAQEWEEAKALARYARQQIDRTGPRVMNVVKFPYPDIEGEYDAEIASQLRKWSHMQACIGAPKSARLYYRPLPGAEQVESFQSPWGSTARTKQLDPRERFPSPELGLAPGEYATWEEVEHAKNAVRWARKKFQTHYSQTGRFESPTFGVGPGEFATADELEEAKRAIRWARMRSQVGIASDERLRYSQLVWDPEAYDTDLMSDFDGLKPGKLTQFEVYERFPSPTLGAGPGDYESVDDLEMAKSAVRWARQQTRAMKGGERFPEPTLGLGPGEYESPEGVAFAKRAMMWSRQIGQLQRDRANRLTFLNKTGVDLIYDGVLPKSFAEGGRSRFSQDICERFPSPVLGTGPGDYDSQDEHELAKKAVQWARQRAEMLSNTDRFPSPTLGVGPGEFTSQEEIDGAKRAMMWSRLRAHIGDAVDERLHFPSLEGADEIYEKALVSDFGNPFVGTRDLWEKQLAHERFPSPKFGLGPGEYETDNDYEIARKAVQWARDQWRERKGGFGRFPSPVAGLGPGEFENADEVDAAKRAIAWARFRSRREEMIAERLDLVGREKYGCVLNFDHSFLSDFGDIALHNRALKTARERFPSPQLGSGPGEYNTQDELEFAANAVQWARNRFVLDGIDRFYLPSSELGPGDYEGVEEFEAARKAILWSRLRRQVGEAAEERLVFVASQGAGVYDQDLLSSFGLKAGSSLTWGELCERFPSPTLGKGPGEYESAEEYELARKAIQWARKCTSQLDQGKRFPEITSDSFDGYDLLTPDQIEAARKAVMWSRLQKMLHLASERHLQLVDKLGIDAFYDGIMSGDFEKATPTDSNFLFVDSTERFRLTSSKLGPGDYEDETVVEETRQLSRWMRQQRQTGSPKQARLEFTQPAGADETYSKEKSSFQKKMIEDSMEFTERFHPARPGYAQMLEHMLLDAEASNAYYNRLQAQKGWETIMSNLRERFPSPELGDLGEYCTVEELEEGKRAVYWARQQALSSIIGNEMRFTEPRVFDTEESPFPDSEFGKQAITWSRLQGQINQVNKRIASMLSGYDGAQMSTDFMLPEDVRANLTWGQARLRFPSPTFGNGPGDYTSIEEYENAKKAVAWSRAVAMANSETLRFPSPKFTPGAGEYVTEIEIEEAKRAVMWSRVAGQVGTSQDERLTFPRQTGPDADFLVSEREVGRVKWDASTIARFPSPIFGHGPGEYSTPEEYNLARRAIYWARQQQSEGDRFPSPRIGLGPGEFASESDLQLARDAIAWSRGYAQIADASSIRLVFPERDTGESEQEVERWEPPRFAQSWDPSVTERFPSPTMSDHDSVEGYALAKKAVCWARIQANLRDEDERFPSPQIGTGPGDFENQDEVDAAKKAIMWARQRAQVGEAVQERLQTLVSEGAHLIYDGAYLSDFGSVLGKSLSQRDILRRFPSPVLGSGPGEYVTTEELELARKAIHWARGEVAMLSVGERLPEPRLGVGPGEFETFEELEAAKQAIMWARLRGQIGEAAEGRLEYLKRSGADQVYDQAILCAAMSTKAEKARSEFRGNAMGRESARLRFPSPMLGLGPGEYASEEELTQAKAAVEYARSVWFDSQGERFYEPALGTGPGEYATEEELEQAQRAILWSRMARQIDFAAINPNRLEFEAQSGADVSYEGLMGAGTDGRFGSSFISARERFPSPTLGLGMGEYATQDELERARRAVEWARARYDPDLPDRFPSPTYGLGPGEYGTMEELQFARQAVLTSRRKGEEWGIGFEGTSQAYDKPSQFNQAGWDYESASYLDAKTRFPSPKLGVGPGEYATVEDLEMAQQVVKWSRMAFISQAPAAERFPSIVETVGPGDYKSEAQLADESREQYWARLRALEEIDRYNNVGVSRSDWWD